MASVSGGLALSSLRKPSVNPNVSHNTVSGGSHSYSLGAVTHSTVSGSGGTGNSIRAGYDTVSSLEHSTTSNPVVHGGSEQVVATHSGVAGNTVLHLADGSSIHVIAATHIGVTFFH